MLFNIILLLHFLAFILFLSEEVVLICKPEIRKGKTGMILGIVLLLTGITLVALKYPVVNYYKVIPKTGIFIVITTLKAIYGDRRMPQRLHYLLLGLTILAGLIAAFRV